MAEFWIWNAVTTGKAKQLYFERMKIKLTAQFAESDRENLYQAAFLSVSIIFIYLFIYLFIYFKISIDDNNFSTTAVLQYGPVSSKVRKGKHYLKIDFKSE